MARGSFGSPPPRRAIAECDDAFLAETSFPARRAVTNGRLARGGIGLAAVLVVGGLAAGVPGLAHGAGAPTVGVPLTSVEPSGVASTGAGDFLSKTPVSLHSSLLPVASAAWTRQ